MVSGVPLEEGMVVELSQAVEVWHFDLRSPPEDSGQKSIDLHFTLDGRMNAVAFWYELHLIDGISFSTGPEAVRAGSASCCPSKSSCKLW